MLACQRDKINLEQYHVGDKNGPDFSLSEDLRSEEHTSELQSQ